MRITNNPLRFIDPDGMENQDSQEGFYYSNGYQTLNSKETTGSVTFDGAYMNAGGDGGDSQSSGDGEKDKDINKLNPYALAKLGKAVPIKETYSQEEITTVITTGLSFGLEFTGIAEATLGYLGSAFSRAFGRSVWTLNAFERGRVIERMLGGNLPSNFPVIDRFVNGVATSIKSVDLNSVSYQSASGLSSLLNRYVNSIANFTGRSWSGVQFGTNATNQILSRTLEIAIPRGSATATQQAVMNQIIQRGLNAPNPVTVIFIPL